MPKNSRIPLLNPFKFVPNQKEKGLHFDDDWWCRQIRDWEMRVQYVQKWQRGDHTKLQMESRIAPKPMLIYNMQSEVVKEIEWQAVFNNSLTSFYELDFNVDDLPDGRYCNYQEVSLLEINEQYISEPYDLRDKHYNTRWITYTNTYNDWDVAFTTGVEFGFRCEMDIMDPDFKRERSAYANQRRRVHTTSGTPYRSFKLYVGDARGVAPWVVDLLNRIFVCNEIRIDGKQYESDLESEFEVTRAKGYPLIGASIDIVEVDDRASSFGATNELAPGIVTAYNIETAFFGAGTLVPITDIEKE